MVSKGTLGLEFLDSSLEIIGLDFWILEVSYLFEGKGEPQLIRGTWLISYTLNVSITLDHTQIDVGMVKHRTVRPIIPT